jgi:hypothetical protein
MEGEPERNGAGEDGLSEKPVDGPEKPDQSALFI